MNFIFFFSELGNYIEKKKYIVIGFIAGCLNNYVFDL